MYNEYDMNHYCMINSIKYNYLFVYFFYNYAENNLFVLTIALMLLFYNR